MIGNYDTDVFKLIILTIQEAARVVGNKARYGENAEYDQSFRAIADHARAITFLLAEGLIPGNADRSYVLRRLIRRAARHGRRLGISEPFLDVVCTRVIESMGFFYSDLPKISYRITTEVNLEEKRFSETLDRGLELIAAERARLRDAGGKTLSGEVAFKLYDTYGFPLDLTQDVLRDDGIDVDVAEFERLMEEQRERGRSARRTMRSRPNSSSARAQPLDSSGIAATTLSRRFSPAAVIRAIASPWSQPRRPFILKAAGRLAIAA